MLSLVRRNSGKVIFGRKNFPLVVGFSGETLLLLQQSVRWSTSTTTVTVTTSTTTASAPPLNHFARPVTSNECMRACVSVVWEGESEREREGENTALGCALTHSFLLRMFSEREKERERRNVCEWEREQLCSLLVRESESVCPQVREDKCARLLLAPAPKNEREREREKERES